MQFDFMFILTHKITEYNSTLPNSGLHTPSNNMVFRAFRTVLLCAFHSKMKHVKIKARNSCQPSPMEEYFQSFSQVIMALKKKKRNTSSCVMTGTCIQSLDRPENELN